MPSRKATPRRDGDTKGRGGSTAEHRRLRASRDRREHWVRWGPYLAERAWGTVREDYSADGDAWRHLGHDEAVSRAYRWNEDGIAGISDRHQFVCFAPAFWNGHDRILKERLFGLAGPEGNHGEDVKESYWHLDALPSHAYLAYLYKYPQRAFPYDRLREENARRTRHDREFELVDAGAFDGDRYFDVRIEYAKAAPDDVLVRITVDNRGPERATIHALPTVWFRNTWSWGRNDRRPVVRRVDAETPTLVVDHPYYGPRWLSFEGDPELLFTDNVTNTRRLYGDDDGPLHAKDAFHDRVLRGATDAVRDDGRGTKACAWYAFDVAAGGSATVRARLTDRDPRSGGKARGSAARPFGRAFDGTIERRRKETLEYYEAIEPDGLDPERAELFRGALSGLVWSKQFYHYSVRQWLAGDPGQPPPPDERRHGRNRDWTHLHNEDVLCMPDTWEYPWYASWDLAFHCVPFALADVEFAKSQLVLLLREWFMHPNGQLPAYEWSLSDANPPVHAWAAWRVYRIEQRRTGRGDRTFLERVFHKLLLNFTWWVNRKDAHGNNVFQGGFLGLDNIGVFDRNRPFPGGGHLDQSDATSWMGFYCLNMLTIALELARENPAYEGVASKFFEHFAYICHAVAGVGDEHVPLWNVEDGFYYDVLHRNDGSTFPLRVRSMVGLIPLFSVAILDAGIVARLDGFRRRMEWFLEHRPDLAKHVEQDRDGRVFLSLAAKRRLTRILRRMLDPEEFLSPHGIRSLSRSHLEHPYVLHLDGQASRVGYEPGESRTALFGGNSNWRGPVWLPVNALIVESLRRYHRYLGPEFLVEHPVGSGRRRTLEAVARDLSARLVGLFLRDGSGRRPADGDDERFRADPHWRDRLTFYEYFHGDTGRGLGASHQTGWTALVATLLADDAP